MTVFAIITASTLVFIAAYYTRTNLDNSTSDDPNSGFSEGMQPPSMAECDDFEDRHVEQMICSFERIISAKMAALPALLGDATEAARRNNFAEDLKGHTMAFASIIGGLGLLATNPEFVQHIFDGFSDSYDFWRRAPRECEPTIVADVIAILEEHGVKAAIDGTSKVVFAEFVQLPEIEQRLLVITSCLDPLSKEAQEALWGIEELLEALTFRNQYEFELMMTDDE